LGLKKNNVNIFLSENMKIKFVILCGTARPTLPPLTSRHCILRVRAAIESFKSLVPKGRFSEQEIEKMVCDADIFRKEEEAEKKGVEAECK
jgi:hypothetical protein